MTSRPARRTPRVLVGTSGFSYAAWRGLFYPRTLPAREMLAFYADTFAAVEINSTFYRMPTAAQLAAWAAETPARFRFALKAPQQITHRMRLRDAGDVLRTFAARTAVLGRRRGPLLFQLPPNFPIDLDRLAATLEALPDDVEAAFEFRHPSWFVDAVYGLLSRHGAALCIAEDERLVTPFEATAPFGYLRLRREHYAPRDLAAWARRITAASSWRRAYVFLKHDEAGRAPTRARALLGRLGGAAAT
ncbi:MAG: DUF72 domain-containing protein [Candidatus Binatia bacterium]